MPPEHFERMRAIARLKTIELVDPVDRSRNPLLGLATVDCGRRSLPRTAAVAAPRFRHRRGTPAITYPFVLASFWACALAIAIGTTASKAAL